MQAPEGADCGGNQQSQQNDLEQRKRTQVPYEGQPGPQRIGDQLDAVPAERCSCATKPCLRHTSHAATPIIT